MSYRTVSGRCQDGILAVQMGIATCFIRGPNDWWYKRIRIPAWLPMMGIVANEAGSNG